LIRAVGNKRLDLNDSEYSYFLEIKETLGEADFIGLFKTDKNGLISAIIPPPNKGVNVIAIYFILNVMINQRIRILEGSLKKVENFVDQIPDLPNILKRLERVEKILEKK
tara:strand:- start:16971 stop:17300 length:330 start_codon:yes stop_codon:yes gene_type:complete